LGTQCGAAMANAAQNSDLTAIVLCGGKGERMRPLTDDEPKPLVRIHGRPLLEHLLRYLARAGIRRFILCVGHKAERIEEFARQSCDPAWQVRCVNSGDASMTDRIVDARAHLEGADAALICYGDTLANVDIDALRREHRAHDALATVTIHPFRSPFGIVETDDAGRVLVFTEKPVLPYWINIGFILCEPTALERLQRGSNLPAFLGALAREERLYAYRHGGKHLTVNTEKERRAAEGQIAEFLTLMDR
jgi:glucose-1-phosphate cytidylyltransferase